MDYDLLDIKVTRPKDNLASFLSASKVDYNDDWNLIHSVLSCLPSLSIAKTLNKFCFQPVSNLALS